MTLATDTQSVPEDGAEQAMVEAARATLPRCPRCGSHIHSVQLVAHLISPFVVEYNDDGKGGIDIDAYSREPERLDVEPVYEDTVGSREAPAILVKCALGHQWPEPRLRVRKQYSDEFEWEILPAAQRPDVEKPPLSLPDAASSTLGLRSFAEPSTTSREAGAEDSSRTYCLVMDSGAAWHVTGKELQRCPNDGCDCGEADKGGWLP